MSKQESNLPQEVSVLKLPVFGQIYHTLHCNGCKREFVNKEKVYRFAAYAPTYLLVGECCIAKINQLIDFDPKGSKQIPQLDWSWLWVRQLILRRDGGKCRIPHPADYYGKPSGREDDWELMALEVHHIIPKKDGGTNNFQNLITLCKKCHMRTFANGYGGIPKLQDRSITLDDYNGNLGNFVYPSVTKEPKESSP